MTETDPPIVLVDGIVDVETVDPLLETIDEIRADTGATIQLFDARYVVSATHLERAAELAQRAFDRETNVATDRAVELLLYAAGRRQIDAALEMGISPGETRVVALVDGRPAPDPEGAADTAADDVASLLEPTTTLGTYDRERVLAFYDISETELNATAGDLEDVVLERVALLDVEK